MLRKNKKVDKETVKGRESKRSRIEAARKRKEEQKAKKKKLRFIGFRMWFSIFIAHFYPDLDKVTDRIGSKLYIGNNEVVTKNSKTCLILVTDLGVKAPKFFPSIIEREVKKKFRDVRIDVAMPTEPYLPDRRSGLESRVQQWTKTLERDDVPEKSKIIAERCLYTADLLESKVPLFKVRYYIQCRVGNNDSIQHVEEEVEKLLNAFGIKYRPIKTNIEKHLKYISMLSNITPKDIKDIPWLICTLQTIAEISPNAQGVNDASGMILGTELISMQPYMIDWYSSAGAKNIYIQAPPGEGKTFIALNWCEEARAHGDKIAIRDIKGNEFTEFTKACNGVIINLGPRSDQYVNVWRWDENTKEPADVYTSKMLTLVKNVMLILAKVKPEEIDDLGVFVDDFLTALYDKLGATKTNKNTWYRTDNLTPYIAFEHLQSYLSVDVKKSYGRMLEIAVANWASFFTPTGSNGHTFKREIKYDDFINADVFTLTFDLLSETTMQDEALYKVKTMFATVLEDDYILHNKNLGAWTMMIEEESSIASDFVLESYVKNFLLRRAQNVINVMLGNSLSGLLKNRISRSLMETINMLVIGGVNQETREYMIKQYDLSEEIQNRLIAIKDKQMYESVFVIVNMMQKKPVNGLLKVFVPDSVKNGKIFKGVDVRGKKEKGSNR